MDFSPVLSTPAFGTSASSAPVGADQIPPVRPVTVEMPPVNIREMRKKLGLSQSQFAARFGFATASLKNWEQGRTRPDGAARVLLAVIARHPDAVEDALRDLLEATVTNHTAS